jgi:hypothetical protein
MLKHDNDTRWNSWLLMLESATELQSAICIFIDQHHDEMHKNALSRDEWDTIRETIAILSPFRDTTELLQGDKMTLDEVLQSMDFLIQHVKSKQEEHATDQNLSASLLTMWFAFDKYYKLTDKTLAYTAAILLNPILQENYLNNHWQTLEEHNLGKIGWAVDTARKLW